MPLTDTECAEVFVQVSKMMTERGLGWVVTEVNDAIATGKITPIKVNRRKKAVPESLLSSLFQRAEQPLTDKTGTDEWSAVEYSEPERLKLLLESLTGYIRYVNELISVLTDTDMQVEGHVDPRQMAFATDAGETLLHITPQMARPNRQFLNQLSDIIASISI